MTRLTLQRVAGALALVAAIVLPATAVEAKKKKRVAQDVAASGVMRLLERLPADPLMVTASSVDELRSSIELLIDFVERFDDGSFDREGMARELAAFEQEIGCSLSDELLPSIGPAIVLSVDLPPFDELPLALADPATGFPKMLGGVGLLIEIREPEAFDRCLGALLDAAELVREPADDGMTRVALGPDGELPIHAILERRGDLFALGFDSTEVATSLGGRAPGTRLIDGADFASLFRHLDSAPSSATYVNLPKLAERLRDSALVQGALAQDENAEVMLALLDDETLFATGMGSTTVRLAGISRTSTAGSSLLAGGNAASIGIVAAIAIPNLLNAIDRGKQKRTMADLRSVATAVESFSIDHNRYPRPTDGWEPVDVLADQLSPLYIRVLPTVDGWGHGLLYWSDGASYRLVSPGKDGVAERDWLGAIEPGSSLRFDADIVFGDGSFLRWPEGPQE